MLKLSDNPPVLSPGTESLAELTGQWWVAHTKSRFEKAFAWDLARRDIGYFLPMIEQVRMSGGRKRRVLAPLFSSYVFFCGDEDARYTAMTTHRLCQAIEVLDQESLVAELLAIEKAVQGKVKLDPYPRLTQGARCRVTAGAMRGVEGVVIRRDKLARIVLQVSILGQGAVMEIEADLLELID